MKIVIGSGVGGAMMARELQGHFHVTVLEAGGEFKPMSGDENKLASLRKTGLFLDERIISALFPSMKIRKASRNMVLVYGICTGGTTTLATGNALRYDGALKRAVADCKEILKSAEAGNFHSYRLPKNLYIADATLLPESMGNPPIWTIMALAKRVAKVCTENL